MNITKTIIKSALAGSICAVSIFAVSFTVQANSQMMDNHQANALESCMFAFNQEVADKMRAYRSNPVGNHIEVMKEAVYTANGNYHTCTANL